MSVEFKTPRERRIYRELLKYPEGATIYELRQGVSMALLPGSVRNVLRCLMDRGHVRRYGVCHDSDRKAKNSEPCDIYCATVFYDTAVLEGATVEEGAVCAS